MNELSHIDGKVLLVGEGGFSFSVSLIQKLPSKKYGNITTSSLETEESINKHQYARSNMEFLHQQGVTVLLSTDATQLHTNPNIMQHRYSRIIFNFPHAGGKSNHKKNRKLLNDFFASAAAVLECQGQILVTLCKGQGGTPSDKPMRKWHDSWQVVSMAANASLILVKVLPFITEEYRTYTSTGFRSLDKGFHTENALTHVFEKAESVEVPTDGSNVTVMMNNTVFCCSRYTYFKLLQIRQISGNIHHPVYRVYSILAAELKASCKEVQVKDHGHCLLMRRKMSVNPEIEDENHSSRCREDDNTCVIIERYSLDDLTFVSYASNRKDQNIYLARNSFDLLVNVNDFPDCLCISYGPVFIPCIKSQNQSTVEYHMTICHPITIDDFKNDAEMSPEYLSNNKAIISAVDCVRNVVLPSLRHLLQNHKYTAVFCDQFPENLRTEPSGVRLMSRVLLKQLNHCEEIDSNNVNGTEETQIDLGYIYCTMNSDLDTKCSVYLDLNLHRLSCILFNITDQRLLWSDDHKILEQFGKLETSSNKRAEKLALTSADQRVVDSSIGMGSKLQSDTVTKKIDDTLDTVKPYSLYPMTFTHDMSFWENTETEFCEIEFCHVIQDVALEVVISVELIDKYSDQESKRTSRCYRLTFQSVDKVLSYDTSWKLQSSIRLEVEKRMKIILR